MATFQLMVYKICLGMFAIVAASSNVGSIVDSNATASQLVQQEIAMSKLAKPALIKSDADTVVDGNIAIEQEYDAAMKKGTKPALEFFIKRHPNSPWTATARDQLRALQKK